MTTRRSALKAIAAALMAPAIRLRESIPDERLMLAFCKSDSWIWKAMEKPFGVGSLTYATDSTAMIRAELANRHEDGEIRLPPVERAWVDHWVPGEFIPLTKDNAAANSSMFTGPCPECGDRQISYGELYPDSDLLRDEEWTRRVRYDIDENTIGDPTCQLCCGHEYKGNAVTEICGVFHNSFNLKRVLSIPNVAVSQSRAVPTALLFRGEGFEGISLGYSL